MFVESLDFRACVWLSKKGKNAQNLKLFWESATSYACDYRMHEAARICPGLSNNLQKIHVAFLVINVFNYQKETLNFSTVCLMPA